MVTRCVIYNFPPKKIFFCDKDEHGEFYVFYRISALRENVFHQNFITSAEAVRLKCRIIILYET